MKNMTRGILLLSLAFAVPALYGGEPAGVAGVEVVVKQSPGKRAVTDARGNFVLGALPPGSHTLAFRAQKASDTRNTPANKVAVASSYSIKIDGTKRPVNQSGVTSNNLLGGVDIRVDVGSGATVRGQVLAGATKKMVWVPREPGSHIPGHWAEEGTVAASRANSAQGHPDDLRDQQNRNPNMRDPMAQAAGR